MQNISGFGLRVNIRASISFPVGFDVTEFADDADPFDSPESTVAESAMGLNGDLIVYNNANPLIKTISVITGSESDQNLSALFEANRAGRGKNPVQDIITLTAVFPDGRTEVYSPGAITTGNSGQSVASSGRKKSRTYGFTFENMTTAAGGILNAII